MDDLRTYYDQHKDKYATPRLLAIRSLAFSDDKSARYALEKLQQGTEFNWLKANASGQVDGDTKGLLDFRGNLVTVTSLPAEVSKALENASAGNAYLYSDDAGIHYVLSADRVIPSQLQPFENVQEEILKAVYDEKLQKVMEGWGSKLREVYPVEIYVKEFNDTKL